MRIRGHVLELYVPRKLSNYEKMIQDIQHFNSSTSTDHRKPNPEIIGLQRHVLSIDNPVQKIDKTILQEDTNDAGDSTTRTNNEKLYNQNEPTRNNMKYDSKYHRNQSYALIIHKVY